MDPIRRGSELESLRHNQYFMEAVENTRLSLVNQEDSLMRDITLESEKRRDAMERISMMRILLTDLVDTLDSYILEANNTQFEQEELFKE